MLINRLYDFQDGTIALSQPLDDEFNQILDLINGKLATDNIAPGSVDKDRLSFYVSSYWLDPVNTFTDLESLTPNHGEVCLVKDEPKVYIYDEPSHKWLPFLSTTTHNSLDGRDSTDAHPILAITGLRSELDTTEARITVIENKVARTTDLADVDSSTRADGKFLMYNAVSGKLVYVSIINDSAAGATVTYSSNKIEEKLAVINDKDNAQDSAIALKENKIVKSSTAPGTPAIDDLWLDTTNVPNILNRWNGASWVQVGGSGSGSSKLSDLQDVNKTNKLAGKHIEVAGDGITHIYVDKAINDNVANTSTLQTWSAKKVNDTINAAKPDLTPYQKKVDPGKVGNKNVSETNIADGKILKYNATTGNVEYTDMPVQKPTKSMIAYMSTNQTLPAVYPNSYIVNFNRTSNDTLTGMLNGTFTAPEAGTYAVSVSILFQNSQNANPNVAIYRNGSSDYTFARGLKGASDESFLVTGGTVIYTLNANEKLDVRVTTSNTTMLVAGGFSTYTNARIVKLPEGSSTGGGTGTGHTFANQAILDLIGDNGGGQLTYNGQPVDTNGTAIIDDLNISTAKTFSNQHISDTFYDKSQMDTSLSEKSNVGHTHTVADITDGVYTKAEIDTKVQTLNDTDTGLQTNINGKANTVHTHTVSDITDISGKFEKHITRSVSAPVGPVAEDLWLDTSSTPNVLKRYDGTSWVLVGGSGGGGTGGASIDDTVVGTTTTYSSQKTENTYSHLDHNHNGVYEPVITKNTAFNKNFGTAATDVAPGNHNHDTVYEPKIATKGTAFNKDFAGSGTATTVSHSDHDHSGVYSPVGHTHSEFANIGHVGTKTVDEGNIAVNKVLQWNGANIIYADLPVTTGLKAKQTVYYLTANFSPTANTYAKVPFNANQKNETGTLDNAGSLTITETGYYMITGTMLCDMGGSGGNFNISLYVNGAEKVRLMAGSGNSFQGGAYTYQAYLTANDVIDVRANLSITATVLGGASYTALDITKFPEGGYAQSSAIPKYASYAGFPSGAAAGDVGMNTADYKLYVFKTGVSGGVESTMTSDSTPTPQVTSASSVQSAGYEAFRAFDHVNASATCWASSGAPTTVSPQWIKIDLGSSKNVSSVNLISRNDPTRTVDIKDFIVQSSSDGSTWTNQVSITGLAYASANQTVSYTLPQVINARYWRLYITANNGHAGYVCVGEFNLLSNGNAWVAY